MKYRLKAADGSAAGPHHRRHLGAGGEGGGGRRAEARTARAGRKAFVEAMADFAFLPAGRILAGAGTGRAVTLFNCFVMGRIEDDLAASSRT